MVCVRSVPVPVFMWLAYELGLVVGSFMDTWMIFAYVALLPVISWLLQEVCERFWYYS